ncbi:uncharacterized protein LOC129915025 [Episyrphus balteatus]|uniref:uncharacterized protein LOC129915025 n=1 Tax=Episyrphus balteatus TaxID=286459 RepID=UPI00248670B3|nr:uncharacterized protein LOC129915025 [Episyrphus balteatus]
MRFIICIFFVIVTSHLNSANIESDLLEFIDLVPKNRIAILFGRHFLFDTRFRTAVNYLRSSDFEILMQEQISKSPEVHNIIEYLGKEIDLNVIPLKIRRFINRLRPSSAQEYGSVRGSLSFIQEITQLLPDYEIARLIRDKKSTDPEFGELYEKIKDVKFRELVYSAKNSESMAFAMDVLRSNQIEVDQILEIAFDKINTWSQFY